MRLKDYIAHEPNLIEIKLKDLDSVPEVYYKGERVFDKRLISVDYQWATKDEVSLGKQSVNICGYDIDGQKKIPSIDSISRRRIGGIRGGCR